MANARNAYPSFWVDVGHSYTLPYRCLFIPPSEWVNHKNDRVCPLAATPLHEMARRWLGLRKEGGTSLKPLAKGLRAAGCTVEQLMRNMHFSSRLATWKANEHFLFTTPNCTKIYSICNDPNILCRHVLLGSIDQRHLVRMVPARLVDAITCRQELEKMQKLNEASHALNAKQSSHSYAPYCICASLLLITCNWKRFANQRLLTMATRKICS